jgi:hypothetical protein
MNTRTNQIPKFNELRKLILSAQLDSNSLSKSVLNYERFFHLIKKNPGVKLVPTKDIDIVWHFHLTNFELYKLDSVQSTGYFVKHKRAKTKIELDANKLNYDLTNQLWQSTFNIPYGNYEDMAFCGVDGDGGDDGGYGNNDDVGNDD